MSDDLKNRGEPDRSRVNVNERWEVEYWCSDFGCTEADLREAVSAVGDSVADVRAYITRKKGS